MWRMAARRSGSVACRQAQTASRYIGGGGEGGGNGEGGEIAGRKHLPRAWLPAARRNRNGVLGGEARFTWRCFSARMAAKQARQANRRNVGSAAAWRGGSSVSGSSIINGAAAPKGGALGETRRGIAGGGGRKSRHRLRGAWRRNGAARRRAQAGARTWQNFCGAVSALRQRWKMKYGKKRGCGENRLLRRTYISRIKRRWRPGAGGAAILGGEAA